MLNWDEETKKARTAFIDHEQIDPKIRWPQFLKDWKKRARAQKELKAELSVRHRWTTPDTIEERCLIWQKKAFGRE